MLPRVLLIAPFNAQTLGASRKRARWKRVSRWIRLPREAVDVRLLRSKQRAVLPHSPAVSARYPAQGALDAKLRTVSKRWPSQFRHRVSRRDGGTRRTQHCLHSRFEARQGCGMKLRDARLVDSQLLADLFHGQATLVVERHHQAIALGQAGHGAVQDGLLLPAIALVKGACLRARHERFGILLPKLSGLHRPKPVDAHWLKFLYGAVPLLQADPERASHLVVADRTPQFALQLSVNLLSTLGLLSHVSRGRIQTAQAVEDRASDAVSRVAFELDVFARVELADGVDEAQDARADQIVQVNVGRQMLAHLQRHPLDKGEEPDH